MEDRSANGAKNLLLNAVETAQLAERSSTGSVPQIRHGLGEIDDQHFAILTLVNSLVHAVRIDRSLSKPGQQLTDLRDAVRSHFVSEETLMRVVLYPGLQEHSALHRGLLDRLDALTLGGADAMNGNLETLQQIGDWFVDHFREADRRYVEYVKEHGRTHFVSQGLFERL